MTYPRTELRLRSHHIVPGANIIELWYGPTYLGSISGTDGPGIRLVTAFKATVHIDELISHISLEIHHDNN